MNFDVFPIVRLLLGCQDYRRMSQLSEGVVTIKIGMGVIEGDAIAARWM